MAILKSAFTQMKITMTIQNWFFTLLEQYNNDNSERTLYTDGTMQQ